MILTIKHVLQSVCRPFATSIPSVFATCQEHILLQFISESTIAGIKDPACSCFTHMWLKYDDAISYRAYEQSFNDKSDQNILFLWSLISLYNKIVTSRKQPNNLYQYFDFLLKLIQQTRQLIFMFYIPIDNNDKYAYSNDVVWRTLQSLLSDLNTNYGFQF